MLLAYWLFISTYEEHINALFCMTMDQLHNGPWKKKIILIIMTLFNNFFSSGTVLQHFLHMFIAFLQWPRELNMLQIEKTPAN